MVNTQQRIILENLEFGGVKNDLKFVPATRAANPVGIIPRGLYSYVGNSIDTEPFVKMTVLTRSDANQLFTSIKTSKIFSKWNPASTEPGWSDPKEWVDPTKREWTDATLLLLQLHGVVPAIYELNGAFWNTKGSPPWGNPHIYAPVVLIDNGATTEVYTFDIARYDRPVTLAQFHADLFADPRNEIKSLRIMPWVFSLDYMVDQYFERNFTDQPVSRVSDDSYKKCALWARRMKVEAKANCPRNKLVP